MMTDHAKKQHWVALAAPAWGHEKGLIQLLSNISYLFASVTITLLVHHGEAERCEKERKACLKALGISESTNSTRFEVVSLAPDEGFQPNPDGYFLPIMAQFHEVHYAFAKKWPTLAKPAAGSQSKPVPTTLLADMFMPPPYDVVRSSVPGIRCLLWYSSFFSSLLEHWGPKRLGGDQELFDLCEAEFADPAVRDKFGGQVNNLVAHHLSQGPEGLLQIPGLPDRHGYERNPSHFPTYPPIANLLRVGLEQALHTSDGILAASGDWLEPEAYAAIMDWYPKQTGKVFLQTGLPALLQVSAPSSSNGVDDDKQSATEVTDFLDKQKDRSVLYISFGTVHFPIHQPTFFPILLEVLLAAKHPFVLSRAAVLFPDLGTDLTARLEQAVAAGQCFVSAWIPQTAVVSHRATSAFLTHSGWNSVTEALVAGCPMVFWPLMADQPATAVLMTEKLNAAWELLEVRGSTVAKEAPHRAIDKPLRGTDEAVREEIERVLAELQPGHATGQKKRKNAAALSKRAKDSLQVEGQTAQYLDKVVNGLAQSSQ